MCSSDLFADPKAVPVVRAQDLFPPEGSPNSYRHRLNHPEQNLLYAPGRWFHDRNVEVTYRRDVSDGDRMLVAQPANDAASLLPKTLARLRARQSVTLGVAGDSISTGLDASGLTHAAPFQLGYPDLVAAHLQATFHSEITLPNRAVSGTSIVNGLADLDRMLAEKPHCLIVAYGMNDVGRRDPEWFGKQVRDYVDRARKADAELEIIDRKSTRLNSSH